MPRKSLSLRFSGLLLSTTLLLLVGANKSHAAIIEEVTEDISRARSREHSTSKGGAACNRLENVTTFTNNTTHPIRAGRQAFLHWVNRCGERSELSMRRTVIGNTYWYGWSMFIPSNWDNPSDSYDILAQWPIYPSVRRLACGAAGSYMIRSGDSISFSLQRQGATSETECTKYTLASLSEVRGKWVDFVMQAKWTGNTDGFVKLWMKIGNEPYVEKVNYSGRTYWIGEASGPYFKMGLYKGDPNFKGTAPRYFYTDEYRLGDANAKFEDVAPSGSFSEPKPQPEEPQRISEDFSTSASASNFIIQSGGAWSVSNGKYLLTDTLGGSSPYHNRNVSVHKNSLPESFTLTVDASSTPTSSNWDDFSIIFNYQDVNNYYFAGFNESDNGQTHGIFKVVGGVSTQLANFNSTIQAGTSYNIKVERTRDTINVYRNGSLQGTAKDTTFTRGRAGLGSYNNSATFDNLSVN
ncbi:heparin lyase I family protein [Gloeocapsa sp. BRSZ]